MLKFILKKFRAVESAELELPGITVIAGKNGSGKSSISKVLYSILDTATRFDVFVSADIEEKRSHLFSDVVDLVLNFAYQLQDMPRDVVRTLFPNSRTTNPQSWILDAKKVFGEYQHLFVQNQDAVSTFLTRALSIGVDEKMCSSPIAFLDSVKGMFEKLESEKAEKTYVRPLDVLNERLLGFLEQPIDFERTNVYFDNDPLVKLMTNRVDSPVNVKSVYYIDTPWVSDLCDMRRSRFEDRRLEHREHLARALRTPSKNASAPLFDILRSVVHGETESKRTNVGYRLLFKSDDFQQIFSLFHCATGVKAFSLLQLLLASWKLDEGTLLILDEPESNLHPEWIVEYARAVVLLHKIFGVRFLVSTHSTDFVAGLQAIAKKESVESNVRFYLAERKASGLYEFCPQGFDISSIFDSFNMSLDKIVDYGAEV